MKYHREKLARRHLFECCCMENIICAGNGSSARLKISYISDVEFNFVCDLRIFCLIFVAHIILLFFIS